MKKNKGDRHFQDFLNGMEQIASASQKIIEIGKNISDVESVLTAEERIRDLRVKPFGDGGSHIVIRGNAHVGKSTNVIVKKEKGGR